MALLSVVLPIYNVEEYLPRTLASLARQTHRDIEVVMVDDGSTDGGADIAAAFARSDPRFRLVRQENRGLGAARNTGARDATGEFLTFVDSDDIVPHYAFRTAVATLAHTGSDFLTGKVARIDSRGVFPAPMHREAFTRSVLRTNVVGTPSLMRDLLACNKVYRKAFWDAAGLEFVEGVLYEDGPTSVQAHAQARSVDLLALPIYYWRLRDGASRSLSQQSDDVRFFVDRIRTSQVSAGFLREHHPDLLTTFYHWDIRHKFPIMYKALPLASEEIRQQFIAAAADHLRLAPPAALRGLSRRFRRSVRLTRDGDLAGLLDHLGTVRTGPMAALRKRIRAVAGRSDVVRRVAAYLVRRPSSSRTRGAVTEVRPTDGSVAIRGYGYVAGLPVESRPTAANRTFWARHQATGAWVRLPARSRTDPLATAESPDGHWSYRWSGYDVSVPLDKLRAQSGWRYGVWTLAVGTLTARGLHRGGLRAGDPATRPALAPFRADPQTLVVPFVEHGVLKLRVDPVGAVVEQCRVDGAELVFQGRLAAAAPDPAGAPGPVGTGRLLLSRIDGVAELAVPAEFQAADGQVTFAATLPAATVVEGYGRVPPPPPGADPDRLQIAVEPPGPEAVPVPAAWVPDPAAATGSLVVTGHRVTAGPGWDGGAVVTVAPAGPVAETASWRDGGARLVLAGSGGLADRRPQLVCRHSGRKEERVFPVTVAADGGWTVEIDPERAPHGCGRGPLRFGLWRLVLRTAEDGGLAHTDLPYLPTLLAGEDRPTGGRYRLVPVGTDAAGLVVRSRIADDERGAYHARRLREDLYPAARTELPLRDVVLYDSFVGKQFSDSPRAVYEELCRRGAPVEHLWVTADGQAALPPGVPGVERLSRAWFEALATSRYVVANTHLPAWFRRREGQVVAQTWHGIGFKRVGFDIEEIKFANPAYLANLLREAPNWSFLVSPNSFTTPILRRAFRYEGELCEIGSPRNDVLLTGDRAAIIEEVRREVGLPPDKKIILYAPTWRDNESHGRGMYKFSLRLDLSKVPDRLRREYVLLVRRHPNTVDDLLGQGSDFVWDVANFPDTRHLLAAADVLITDYSTIALDFANTGRPIIFFTYDLASYRDDLRGFYFDLEREGPGPVVETTAEVVDALRDLDAVAERYRDRYDAFRKTFGHAEDGFATSRLIERLFAGHEPGRRPE